MYERKFWSHFSELELSSTSSENDCGASGTGSPSPWDTGADGMFG